MFNNIIIPLAHYLIYGRICTPINNGVWWIGVENNWSKHEEHEASVMKKIKLKIEEKITINQMHHKFYL